MTDHDKSTGATTGLDLDTAFAEVRRNIGELGENIETLRDEADALLERAAGRMALAVLERPEEPGDDLEHLQNSIEALGRHSADIPEEFDPRPYDPDEDDLSTGGAVGGEHMAFEDLMAAPAFEPELETDGQLGAFEIAGETNPLDNSASDMVLADELPLLVELPDDGPLSWDAPEEPFAQEGERHDEVAGHVAEVIPFTPRHGSDEAAAFGHLTPELDGSESPAQADAGDVLAKGAQTDDGETVLAAGSPDPSAKATDVPAATRGTTDGLDAIATTESTEVPENWNGPREDDAAFDKFFSPEVEPEPAQRWLLNE